MLWSKPFTINDLCWSQLRLDVETRESLLWAPVIMAATAFRGPILRDVKHPRQGASGVMSNSRGAEGRGKRALGVLTLCRAGRDFPL